MRLREVETRKKNSIGSIDPSPEAADGLCLAFAFRSPPSFFLEPQTHHVSARQGSVEFRRGGHVDHGGDHCMRWRRIRKESRIESSSFVFLC